MIKRLFLIVLLVWVIPWASFADEQRKITLDNSDRTADTIELADHNINIFVSLKDVDENNKAEITIEIENTHESFFLLLFDKKYGEKTLKKMIPSITYDKIFGGSKGKRDIDDCKDIESTIRISPSETKKLFEKTRSDKGPIVCKLPIYIAKNKNKRGSKILLLEKIVIELEIHVQDTEYDSIKDAYDALRKELDTVTFCTNKYHKGEPCESLKEKYKGKINDLKSIIEKVVDARYNAHKDCEKFINIKNKLVSISFNTVATCSNDSQPSGHNCKNCNLTYEQIYDKLQGYYIDIHNGDNKTKEKVMSEVESLYTCVLKNTKRAPNNRVKRRIIKYYNDIKSLKK